MRVAAALLALVSLLALGSLALGPAVSVPLAVVLVGGALVTRSRSDGEARLLATSVAALGVLLLCFSGWLAAVRDDASNRPVKLGPDTGFSNQP